jgi:hypothetical protein
VGDHTGKSHTEHTWPLTTEEWDGLTQCRECGLVLLRQFIDIADWVVRRVEGIRFVDDRTVRRRVSVDYTVPADGVVLRGHSGPDVRVLPLAMMRRKSMVSFDFRDHDDRPMPLLGLRENQALTLSVIRAWAAVLLEAGGTPCRPALPTELGALIEKVVAGEQSQLTDAYDKLKKGDHDGVRLTDDRFFAVLDRLAGNFVLFGTEPAPPGSRRIVKWSYDEPLTLLHSTTAYQGHTKGPCPPEPLPGRDAAPVSYNRTGHNQTWLAPDPLLAGLGVQPTLIRFPTPGAELAASFHVEITAPPEVSIVSASLLAGLPNLRFDDNDPKQDHDKWKAWYKQHDAAGRPRRERMHRRPSFDSVAGGYATVDLHVADVPYGSLSRAQVELQASPSGWLATAWLGALLGTLMLLAAFVGRQPDRPDVPALVLVTYAVGMVAIVVRPDPHVMATRLLSSLRMLAGFTVILTLAGALAYTFLGVDDAHVPLGVLAAASLLPSGVLTWVWLLARRRMPRERLRRADPKPEEERRTRTPKRPGAHVSPTSWAAAIRRLRSEYAGTPMIRLSPWEQHLPMQEDAFDPRVDRRFRKDLAEKLEDAEYPYDQAVVSLGFDRPAVKVASAESDRVEFMWTAEFKQRVTALLGPRVPERATEPAERFTAADDREKAAP